jgi:hypothetical protein
MCEIMRRALASAKPFRLAKFQALNRAHHPALAHASGQQQTASATIVCAGTGVVKPYRFTFQRSPALRMRSAVILRASAYSSDLPAHELLKDQFAETFAQCRKLDGYMQANAGRKIRIAAFFGDTPVKAE